MIISAKILTVLTASLMLAGCQSSGKTLQVAESFASAKIVETDPIAKRTKPKTAKLASHKLDPFAGTGSPYFEGKGELPRGGGRAHVGKPFQVAGRWYRPKADPSYNKVGMASWYGEAFHARKTANGEYFNMQDMTAAHPTLPLPSYAKVTNTENGQEIIVRINDRGPFVGTRLIDLSKRSAEALDFKHKGKAKVRVQWIGPAPLDDQGSHLTAMNRRLKQGASIAALRNAEPTARQVAAFKPTKVKSRIAKAKPTQIVEQDVPSDVILVQVAVYKSRDKAEAALKQASAFGNTKIVKGRLNGQLAYRVQMGPYRSIGSAKADLKELQLNGYATARLIGDIPTQQLAAR
jgi:rare lipoprotein A